MTASGEREEIRLSEFPLVYMSYDEPWAEDGWAEVKKIRPDAKRVHGVKGLNACHVAAADTAGAEWFITLDADTTLLRSVLDVTFDAKFLQPDFRLDWQSRNSANGLISGNGSLKLWPTELVRAMCSHEAASEGTVSLDAEIGDIRPGKTRLVQMEGCHSITDPAMTPYHAFRAGFRETVFLSWLLKKEAERDGVESRQARTLRRILSIWCTFGCHHTNGRWLLFGARLGLWTACAWPEWDVRLTTDYTWLTDFWTRTVRPRIGQGASICRWSRHTWNEDRLSAEIVALGQRLANRMPEIEMVDFGPEESALFVDAHLLPTIRTAENMDALGHAFHRGRIVAQDNQLAHALYDIAALLMYPPAINNIARLHKLDAISGANREMARQLFKQASALGNPHAPFHLAGMLLEERGTRDAEIEALFDLASERGFAPAPGVG